MTNLVYVFRYFRVVPPISPLMISTFVVLTIAGAAATVLTNDRGATAIIPVVVLQAFSASTGFAVPARRGYFDVLIARGESLTRIAVAQWLTAIGPGLASWVIVAAAGAMVDGVAQTPLLASGTAVAFLMASTIPWAVGVSLPRFSGAIGWLLIICLGGVGGVIWPDSVREVVFPVDLVGEGVRQRPEVLIPAVTLCSLTVLLALIWIRRTDIPLEAAQ